jgi:hypothetical protein
MRNMLKVITIVLFLIAVNILMSQSFFVMEVRAQPSISLPPGPTTIVVYRTDPCYLSTPLSGVPPGYDDVPNGIYCSYCVKEYIFITPGQQYSVTLRSSYDPNLPSYAQDPDWPKINYILNHKQGNWFDIQTAIWYFFDGGNLPPVGSVARAIVDDAVLNGQSFIPGFGESMAVICDAGPNVQLTFIEVDLEHSVKITKTALDEHCAPSSDKITYQFEITNNGEEDITSLTVNDPKLGLVNYLPPGETGYLAVGESITFTYEYTVNPGDLDPLVNTATVSATLLDGATVTDTSTCSVDLHFHIDGVVFHDRNKNGLYDSCDCEYLFNDTVVQFFDSTGNLVATTNTDILGQFFQDLPPGIYTVTVPSTGGGHYNKALYRGYVPTTDTSVQIQLDTCSINHEFGFGPLPPVGGVLLSVNKLEILTPYLALAGLIVAASTVYVIKKRKD